VRAIEGYPTYAVSVLPLAILAVVLGLAIGVATGGKVRRVGEIHLRWWGLALGGLGLQLVPVPPMDGSADRWMAAGLYALSYVVLFVFVMLNVRRPGFALLGVGFALNALVIGINGGMPVSEHALRSLAGDRGDAAVARLESQGGLRHHLATDDDVLRPLGDVIPIPGPVSGVFSIGDLLALIGATWVIAAATHGERKAEPSRSEDVPVLDLVGRDGDGQLPEEVDATQAGSLASSDGVVSWEAWGGAPLDEMGGASLVD
jgi:hypothetical protein